MITLPKLGEHLIFCGTTGSGKTVLAQELLSNYDKIFVFDTQDSLKIPDAVKVTSPIGLGRKLKSLSRIRYVPKLEYRTKDYFNAVIKYLLLTKNIFDRQEVWKNGIIYIDEIYHIGYGQSFPDWLSRGIATARQKKISIWVSSQRPTNIPMPLMTESRRIYLFYLSYAEDLKKISKFTRDEKHFLEVIRELKYDYSFIELDRITGMWRKLPKLQIKGG